MNNLISKNAYAILGLSPGSTQKEIAKRAKEIEKYIHIDEIPEYELDFGFYYKLRSLENIKLSLQYISNPKNRILHYFFSIYITGEEEKKTLEQINKNVNYETVIRYFENYKDKSLMHKKNAAILLTFLLLNSDSDVKKISELSVNLWKEILESDKNWKDFRKIYLLDDEIGVNDNVFDNSQEFVKQELAKIYSHASEIHEDNTILAEFLKNFNIHDSSISIKQIDEIYNEIDETITNLEKMKISEDGIFDNEEKQLLHKYLQNIQNNFNNLIDLRLYENSRTIILRDKTAETIRVQLLDLHNNLNEKNTSLKLLDIAISVCGTEGLKEKLKADQKTIKSNVVMENYFGSIDEVLKKIEKNVLYCSSKQLQEYVESIIEKLNFIESSKEVHGQQLNYFKDTIALSIRSIAIDIHNKNQQAKRAKELLSLSLPICATNKTLKLYNEDIATIQETINYQSNPLNNPFLRWILQYVIFFGLIFGIALIAEYPWILIVIGIGFLVWFISKKMG